MDIHRSGTRCVLTCCWASCCSSCRCFSRAGRYSGAGRLAEMVLLPSLLSNTRSNKLGAWSFEPQRKSRVSILVTTNIPIHAYIHTVAKIIYYASANQCVKCNRWLKEAVINCGLYISGPLVVLYQRRLPDIVAIVEVSIICTYTLQMIYTNRLLTDSYRNHIAQSYTRTVRYLLRPFLQETDRLQVTELFGVVSLEPNDRTSTYSTFKTMKVVIRLLRWIINTLI